MSVTHIAVVIILVILGSIAAIYISQAKERARIEKTRKINGLQDRYRRMQRIYAEIPPQYLNNELRTMILNQTKETLNKLAPYNVDPNIPERLQDIETHLKALKENTYKAVPVEITSNESSKEVAKLLEVLYRFVESELKKKKLDPKSARKYLAYINYLICKCRADYFSNKSKSLIKDGKLRVAIHNYHNAIQEYMRLKDNPLAVKAINSLRARIKELDQQASKDKLKTEQEQADQQKQSKEWDKYMDEDDKWKKKNAYDD